MLRPQTAFALSCVVLAAAAVTATAAIPAGDDLRDHLVRTYALPDRIAGALADAADASPATTRTGGGRVAPGFEPAVARDLNPDPDVVEVVLVAIRTRVSYDGARTTDVWSYNGSVPGPTIAGTVGDTLTVHLLNLLPEGTTVHWHGLELPADATSSSTRTAA